MPRNALRHDKNATKRGCVSRRRRDAMRLHERQTIVPRIPRAIKKQSSELLTISPSCTETSSEELDDAYGLRTVCVRVSLRNLLARTGFHFWHVRFSRRIRLRHPYPHVCVFSGCSAAVCTDAKRSDARPLIGERSAIEIRF